MLETIWAFLSNTPTWVYILFAYLVYVGIKSTRERIRSLPRIFIFPIIFLFVSSHHLLTLVQTGKLRIIFWLAAFVIGLLLGFWHIMKSDVRVDRGHNLLAIPGTWVTLIAVLIIFFSNYYFAVVNELHPQQAEQLWFIASMFIILGLSKGYFIGKALTLWYRFKTSKITVNLRH